MPIASCKFLRHAGRSGLATAAFRGRTFRGAGLLLGGERQMHFHGKAYRSGLLAAGVALGVLVSTSAQALNFSFRFSGNMSCMRPVPVSNAPISGSGTGVLNPDGSVTAEISQSLLVFSTSLRFYIKL